MKHDWAEGDQIEIAWNNYQENGLLPRSGNWTRGKAIVYGLISVVLLCVALWMGLSI